MKKYEEVTLYFYHYIIEENIIVNYSFIIRKTGASMYLREPRNRGPARLCSKYFLNKDAALLDIIEQVDNYNQNYIV